MHKDMFEKLSKWFILFLLLLISAKSIALPFSVFTKPGTQLPTSVPIGSTVIAYYTVSNNTLSQRNFNFVKYLPPNTFQIPNGTFPDTCGFNFNLSPRGFPGDSCTLQIGINGAVNANDPDPHHHLFVCFPGGITCAGTNNPLNVQVVNVPPPTPPVTLSLAITPVNSTILVRRTQQYAAIVTFSDGTTQDVTNLATWQSSNPAVATISSTGLVTAKMAGTTTITATYNNVTSNVATLNVISIAYVTQTGDNTVSACVINSDGTFGTCTKTGNGFNLPFGGAITPDGNFLFIPNSGNNTVSSCPILSTGLLGTCTAISSATFGQPRDIAFNSTGTIAYITNFGANQISICPVANGTLGTCTAFISGFTQPFGIAINATNTFAYVANNTTSVVSLCPINPDGSLSACATTGSGFSNPQGFAINASNTQAYTANNTTGDISLCTIDLAGTLSGCVTTGAVPTPNDIALNANNTFAYVPDGVSQVFLCPVNSNGTLGTCNIIQPAFANPTSVIIL